jgi:NAD(P)-dependent dehydrogenase (short-subunit alcohol dehydrogenase family)
MGVIGFPQKQIYVASKQKNALLVLTKSAALEYAKSGIRTHFVLILSILLAQYESQLVFMAVKTSWQKQLLKIDK